jgi:hypothetical protein
MNKDWGEVFDWAKPPKDTSQEWGDIFDWAKPPEPEPPPMTAKIKDTAKNIGGAIGKGAEWLGKNLYAGAGDFSSSFYKTLQSVGGDKVPGLNKFLDWGVEGTEKAQELGGTDIGSQVVRSLPGAGVNLGLAFMTGGASTAGIPSQGAEAVRQTTMQMMKKPTFLTSAMRSYGSGYGEAMDEGATRLQGISAGLQQAIPQAIIEQAGGIEQLPNRASEGLLRTIGRTALEEAGEEIAQYPFEGLAKKATYAPETPIFSLEEQAVINPLQQAQAGLVGGIAGGLMGGVGGVSGRFRPNVDTTTGPQTDIHTDTTIEAPIETPEVFYADPYGNITPDSGYNPPLLLPEGSTDSQIEPSRQIEAPMRVFPGEIDPLSRMTHPAFQVQQETAISEPSTEITTETETPQETTFTVETDEGPQTYDSNDFVDDTGTPLEARINEDPVYRELSDSLEGTSSESDSYIKEIAPEIKDKSGLAHNIDHPQRGLKSVFGKHWNYVKEHYFDPFDRSKGDYAREVITRADKIYNEVVQKYGIKKGSKESAAIQWYGEGERIVGSDRSSLNRLFNPEYEVVTNEAGQEVRVPKTEKYTLEDLKRDFPNKWKDIVEAEKVFRQQYDELIDLINESRKKVYPSVEKQIESTKQRIKDLTEDINEYQSKLKDKNLATNERKDIQRRVDDMIVKREELTNKLESGELWRNKRVPKRKNYFRHFKELNSGVTGLINIMGSPYQIDPKLAGISEFTKPKSKWASFMQQRGFGDYTADAVGGFLDYIRPASYAVHIDPHITKFRQLAKDIADGTQNTKNANNLILFLNDYANSLAGKTNKFDRLIQDMIPGGRKTFAVINWLNRRARANAVLGNLRSSITQIANIPAGIAEVNDPVALSKGMGETLANILGRGSKAIEQSDFITERYVNSVFDKFDTKLASKPKQFAAWLLGAGDEFGTRFTWNSAYYKALKDGIPNPTKYADDLTRNVVAGRGIGEVPLMQQSKLFQTFFPFTLEVGNIAHVMGKQIKGKEFSKLITFVIANFVFNEIAESAYGDRPLPDPIDAMMDILSQDDPNFISTIGRLGGETLSNIPGGQTIASLWPEYETDVTSPLGDYTIPSRQQLFGDSDPTRYGTGFLLQEALRDPFYKLALPWGGGQLKKTVQGAEALQEGGYIKDGKLRYLVPPTTENIAKSLMFGRSATPEAREYFEKDRRPLSEQQTQAVLQSRNPQEQYRIFMLQREANRIQQQMKDVSSDQDLTTKERDQRIRKLQQKLNEIWATP